MVSDKIWSIKPKSHLKYNAKQEKFFPSDIERTIVFRISMFIEIPVFNATSIDPGKTPHSVVFYGTLGLNGLRSRQCVSTISAG